MSDTPLPSEPDPNAVQIAPGVWRHWGLYLRGSRGPTMPDTLTPEQIDTIRRHAEHGITQDAANVRALLAHIDALTAAHKECVEQCCRCCPALSEEPHDA